MLIVGWERATVGSPLIGADAKIDDIQRNPTEEPLQTIEGFGVDNGEFVREHAAGSDRFAVRLMFRDDVRLSTSGQRELMFLTSDGQGVSFLPQILWRVHLPPAADSGSSQ